MNPLIKDTFLQLKAKKKKAIIPFLTADFPSKPVFKTLLHELPKTGADIIEIGIPFSDPMADGTTIQKTSEIAITNGFSLSQCFDDIAEFKQHNPHIPIVLMSYTNPIIQYGAPSFTKDSLTSGVDGLLLVDCPPEHQHTVLNPNEHIDMIRLITPTTPLNRMPIILDGAGGFTYYVSVKGITGSQSPNPKTISDHVALLKDQLKTPMVIGFGISTPTAAKEMATISDGVVIGSAFLAPFIQSSPSNDPKTIQKQLDFIASINQTVNHD